MKEQLTMEERKRIRRRRSRCISTFRTLLEITLVCIIIFGYNLFSSEINGLTNTIDKTQAELNNTREQTELLLAAVTPEGGVTPTIEDAVATTQDMRKQLDVYKEREELYNKYEYVLFYNGERTDMTYEHVAYAEDLMDEKGVDPNMLFGLVMVESKAQEKAQNKTSTARGFCQILASTGRGIYNKYFNKPYDHSYAFDGYKNLEMGATLVATNMERYNGDTYTVIQRYRGLQDVGTYYAAVDNYVNRGGTSLRQIGNEYLQ